MTESSNIHDKKLALAILEVNYKQLHPLWLRRLLTNICDENGQVENEELQKYWYECQMATNALVSSFHKRDNCEPKVNYFI